MTKQLRRIGDFYKKIILNNIGIFIFIGILSVVFHDYGWIPNKDMYAISQLVYKSLLPAFISYEAGRQVGGSSGGITALLAVSGIIAADIEPGIFSGLILGPISGLLWKYSYDWMGRKSKAALQMLFQNLWLGILGSLLAGVSYFVIAPLMELVMESTLQFMSVWLNQGMLIILSLLIEPAKVFFLNNLINHGIFIPIGMSQAAAVGSSVFFLLETNPGPGLGMLAALFMYGKDKKGECGAAIFTQAIGGLHEVYFPYVLSNLWLLLPLLAGGAAGNLTFLAFHASLQGPASPGSIITILLMAGKESFVPVMMGIAVSALTAFAGSVLVIRGKPLHKFQECCMELKGNKEAEISQTEENIRVMERPDTSEKSPIQNVAVVCDGGVGTSAMGAAIVRRLMSRENIPDVSVEAFAADLLPEQIGMIICQTDFYEHAPRSFREQHPACGHVYMVESLLDVSSYDGFLNLLKERNG